MEAKEKAVYADESEEAPRPSEPSVSAEIESEKPKNSKPIEKLSMVSQAFEQETMTEFKHKMGDDAESETCADEPKKRTEADKDLNIGETSVDVSETTETQEKSNKVTEENTAQGLTEYRILIKVEDNQKSVQNESISKPPTGDNSGIKDTTFPNVDNDKNVFHADKVDSIEINRRDISTAVANLVAVAMDADDETSSSSTDDQDQASNFKQPEPMEVTSGHSPLVKGSSQTEVKVSADSTKKDSSSQLTTKNASKPKPTRRRVITERICVNPNCTTSGNSNSDSLQTAKSHVLGHFGVKPDKTKKRKVCFTCLESADIAMDRMVERLKSRQMIIEEKLAIPTDAMVTLDDSDQEMQTDSSSASEFEWSVSDSSGDENEDNEESSSAAVDLFAAFVRAEVEKHEVATTQVDASVNNLIERMDKLMPVAKERDKELNDLEKLIDQMREDLYRPFKPVPKFLEPLEDVDRRKETEHKAQPSSSTQARTMMPNAPGLPSPARRIPSPATYPLPPKPKSKPDQPIHEEFQPSGVSAGKPAPENLPQYGPLHRPLPKVGDKVYGVTKTLLDIWRPGTVTEINEGGNGDKMFSVKFVTKEALQVNLKLIAYTSKATVRLGVGTRVIASFKDPLNPAIPAYFYSAIIAEPPKPQNKFRYLVFYDDGFASYITHDNIRVVCQQSASSVWEDVDENSRDFIKKYLLQYPERPLVKLAANQLVRAEWNGSWYNTRVEEVDASLVKLYWPNLNRSEWIYRGSPRLEPLHLEMLEQKRRAEQAATVTGGTGSVGVSKSTPRRVVPHNPNRPFVEWTWQVDEKKAGTSGDSSASAAQPERRAVARKSAGGNKNKNPGTNGGTSTELHANDENRIRWDLKGKIEKITCDESLAPKKFVSHQCSPACMANPKVQYDGSKMKGVNPLLMPLKLGWKRQVTKHNNFGRRRIFYVTPCGRRLRDLAEVHKYLRVTQSKLEIDFFNFDWYVHVCNEFVPDRQFCYIPDISYGKEAVPVSCVNSLDKNFPEYVEYSTVRLPQKNVTINLDEGFLTCCDCVDDCADKSKCACQQLTILHTDASNSDRRLDKDVGYEYRRLMKCVSTGLFECNSRCKCSKTCLNRVVQLPLRAKLQVFHTERRGWGIRTLCDIPRGGFICTYVGNLYTSDEANEKGQDFGDEYFAELDLIEVVERYKDDYESDVDEDEGLDDDDVISDNDGHPETDDVDVLSDELGLASSDEEAGAVGKGRSGPLGLDHEAEDMPYRVNHVISTEATDRQTRSKNRVMTSSEQKKSLPGEKNPLELHRQQSEKSQESETKSEKPKFISTRKLFGKDEDVYIMDAKSIGNIGRYLNHSCSPNVFVQSCYVDTHDLRFPWVAFFAQCHIPAGQELCWDYAYIPGQVEGKEINCACGADSCRGRLL